MQTACISQCQHIRLRAKASHHDGRGSQGLCGGFLSAVTNIMAMQLPANFSSSEVALVLGDSLHKGNQNSQSEICGRGVYFLLGFFCCCCCLFLFSISP